MFALQQGSHNSQKDILFQREHSSCRHMHWEVTGRGHTTACETQRFSQRGMGVRENTFTCQKFFYCSNTFLNLIFLYDSQTYLLINFISFKVKCRLFLSPCQGGIFFFFDQTFQIIFLLLNFLLQVALCQAFHPSTPLI